MPHRYKKARSSPNPFNKLTIASALRQKWRESYSLKDLRCDIMAGTVVAMVAIPLGMALAIACGVPPQNGLYTVIIGGAVVALLGGSRFQVTGPTAAFVVILAPVTHKFGLAGLLVAGLMAGVILVAMGLARMGRVIQFIPYPVTTGFTAGIAVVIATLQIKDFLGLSVPEMPERFVEKVIALAQAKGSASVTEFIIGTSTLLILMFWRRVNRKIPAPLIGLAVVSMVTAFLKNKFPNLEFATIGSRFTYELGGLMGHGIPQTLPHFDFPWNFSAGNGKSFQLSFASVESLVPSALAIAMLGAIESLLSAVVADGMTQTKHDSDAELVALGTGNILCPFFGGIAATGAIARTATNIRFGAKSPLASFFHAVFTLIVLLLLAPYVSYLPMAALAALLMVVAYNMSDVKHVFHILRVAPKSDMLVLLLCFFLTVVFDMVVGVTVGVMLAALLFMNRMASVTSAQVVSGNPAHFKEPLPKEILHYEISGPLFFGAAERAAEVICAITDNIRAVIVSMDSVPVMDVTGLVAFESAIQKLTRHNRHVFLVGVKKQPRDLLLRDEFLRGNKFVSFCNSLEEALELAKKADSSSGVLHVES